MTIFLEDSLHSLPCLQRGLLTLWCLRRIQDLLLQCKEGSTVQTQFRMESVATLGSTVFHTATKRKKPLFVVFASALVLAPSSVLVVLPLSGSGSSGKKVTGPCSLVSLPRSWAPPGASVMLLRNTHGVDVV